MPDNKLNPNAPPFIPKVFRPFLYSLPTNFPDGVMNNMVGENNVMISHNAPLPRPYSMNPVTQNPELFMNPMNNMSKAVIMPKMIYTPNGIHYNSTHKVDITQNIPGIPQIINSEDVNGSINLNSPMIHPNQIDWKHPQFIPAYPKYGVLPTRIPHWNPDPKVNYQIPIITENEQILMTGEYNLPPINGNSMQNFQNRVKEISGFAYYQPPPVTMPNSMPIINHEPITICSNFNVPDGVIMPNHMNFGASERNEFNENRQINKNLGRDDDKICENIKKSDDSIKKNLRASDIEDNKISNNNNVFQTKNYNKNVSNDDLNNTIAIESVSNNKKINPNIVKNEKILTKLDSNPNEINNAKISINRRNQLKNVLNSSVSNKGKQFNDYRETPKNDSAKIKAKDSVEDKKDIPVLKQTIDIDDINIGAKEEKNLRINVTEDRKKLENIESTSKNKYRKDNNPKIKKTESDHHQNSKFISEHKNVQFSDKTNFYKSNKQVGNQSDYKADDVSYNFNMDFIKKSNSSCKSSVVPNSDKKPEFMQKKSIDDFPALSSGILTEDKLNSENKNKGNLNDSCFVFSKIEKIAKNSAIALTNNSTNQNIKKTVIKSRKDKQNSSPISSAVESNEIVNIKNHNTSLSDKAKFTSKKNLIEDNSSIAKSVTLNHVNDTKYVEHSKDSKLISTNNQQDQINVNSLDKTSEKIEINKSYKSIKTKHKLTDTKTNKNTNNQQINDTSKIQDASKVQDLSKTQKTKYDTNNAVNTTTQFKVNSNSQNLIDSSKIKTQKYTSLNNRKTLAQEKRDKLDNGIQKDINRQKNIETSKNSKSVKYQIPTLPTNKIQSFENEKKTNEKIKNLTPVTAKLRIEQKSELVSTVNSSNTVKEKPVEKKINLFDLIKNDKTVDKISSSLNHSNEEKSNVIKETKKAGLKQKKFAEDSDKCDLDNESNINNFEKIEKKKTEAVEDSKSVSEKKINKIPLVALNVQSDFDSNVSSLKSKKSSVKTDRDVEELKNDIPKDENSSSKNGDSISNQLEIEIKINKTIEKPDLDEPNLKNVGEKFEKGRRTNFNDLKNKFNDLVEREQIIEEINTEKQKMFNVPNFLLNDNALSRLDQIDFKSDSVTNKKKTPVSKISPSGHIVWSFEDIIALRKNLIKLQDDQTIMWKKKITTEKTEIEKATKIWVLKQKEEKNDEKLAKKRRVRALLNRLTGANQDAIFDEIVSKIDTTEDVGMLINLLFEKACTQHHYIPLYADLTCNFHQVLTDKGLFESKSNDFRHLILHEAQAMTNEQALKDYTPPEGLDDTEAFENLLAHKLKIKGNMKFIAELYTRRMMSSKVSRIIVSSLLNANGAIQLEACFSFLNTLMIRGVDDDLRQHFQNKLKELTEDPNVNLRLKFLIQDYLEGRQTRAS